MRYLPTGARSKSARRPCRAVLHLEALESRITPYVTSGGAWVNPQLITISFVPDGTILGYDGQGQALTSTLFQDFSALGSTTTWQNQILKAAQVWAQQTDVNFAAVSDDGVASGSGNYEQGDPNHGDIRIGGYQEGTTGMPLATAWMPPQLNNYDIAGDITFNTSQPFNIGSTYDLFSVAAHEFGHALGMDHSTDITAVMFSAYSGTDTGLASDDIAGIRSIYSSGNPRTHDSNSNNTFATATSVSIDPVAMTALVTGQDISVVGDTDYYSFVAPAGSAATANITVQSSGLSMLAPKLYVYNSAHAQIAYKNGAGHYGTTLTATPSITAGSTYYIKVVGADTSAFGTGAYAITINTGTGSSPTVPLPNTQVLNQTPRQSTGGAPERTPGEFDLLFANGDPVASDVATTVVATTPTGGASKAAVAIGLAQLNSARVQTVVVTPNMVPADLNFQAGAVQAPGAIAAGRLAANWPDYGGDSQDVSDTIFSEMMAPTTDGQEALVPSWFGPAQG
jgi:hypothetical protein